MRVLVACEFSGVVREAFRRRGHEAWSCDILPALDESPYHYETDVQNVFDSYPYSPRLGHYWDLIIAHPPCTYLTVAGNRYHAKNIEAYTAAASFAKSFFDYSDKVCVENPVGRLSTLYRRPDQIIQPYEFGEDASKKTCLWLKGLPLLQKNPAKRIPGRVVSGVERWSNQTDSGQNRLGPSEDRAAIRSITYQGIADAMAEQWG